MRDFGVTEAQLNHHNIIDFLDLTLEPNLQPASTEPWKVGSALATRGGVVHAGPAYTHWRCVMFFVVSRKKEPALYNSDFQINTWSLLRYFSKIVNPITKKLQEMINKCGIDYAGNIRYEDEMMDYYQNSAEVSALIDASKAYRRAVEDLYIKHRKRMRLT